MDRDILRLKSLEIRTDYREVIRVLTGWIYRRIRIMRVWRVSCYLLLSECSVSFWVQCLIFLSFRETEGFGQE